MKNLKELNLYINVTELHIKEAEIKLQTIDKEDELYMKQENLVNDLKNKLRFYKDIKEDLQFLNRLYCFIRYEENTTFFCRADELHKFKKFTMNLSKTTDEKLFKELEVRLFGDKQ